ncbi:MAG: response regulator [Phycisphaerae bacterium]|jgi:CheY-like chemotaxis protein/HPt (histidine-containing phosphotransfer) domain-containing protein|nr:response regulator [Phycisphaerae bacterium]
MDDQKHIRILIAESCSVSRLVAAKHLEKAGYTADIVDNGRQVLETIQSKNYALLLMDIQMPVMDGYDVSRAIRKMEKEKSIAAIGNHLPIIAMVDYADEEHLAGCYAAGMDDCLAKPLRKDNLLAMIKKWVPRNPPENAIPCCNPATSKTSDRHASQSPSTMNMERALAEFDGNWTFLKGVFSEFFKQVHQQLSLIVEAINRGDTETIRAQAHSIKGGAANLTADSLAKLAIDLETRGKTGDLDDAQEIVRQMENIIQQLKISVDEFRTI